MPLKGSTPINPAAMRIDYSPMARAAQAKSQGIMALGNAVQVGIQKAKETREKNAKKDAALAYVKDWSKMTGVDVPEESMKNLDIEEILNIKDQITKTAEAEKIAKAQVIQQARAAKQQDERIQMERERLAVSQELSGLEIKEANARLEALGKEREYTIEDPGEEFDYLILKQPNGAASMMPKKRAEKEERISDKDMTAQERRDSRLKQINESRLSNNDRIRLTKEVNEKFQQELLGDEETSDALGRFMQSPQDGAGWGVVQ
jgi:hypothetical protein